ncbi:MAG: hypothetical protein WBM90_00780 [Acidimicrobiia bacterium]
METHSETVGRFAVRTATIVGISLAVLSGLLAVAATIEGLQVNQRDSPTYLSSAESLAVGEGSRTQFGVPGKPIDFNDSSSTVTHYPPGYPLLLSVGVRMGFDSIEVARILGVVSLSLFALVFFEFARRRGLPVAGSALVCLVAVALSFPYVLAPLSELIYGLLTLITLVLLANYLVAARVTLLIAASIVASLAVAVRSIGLALVATVAIVALFPPGRAAFRLMRGIAAGMLGLGVFALSAAGGSRELFWHPPAVGELKVAANAIVGWLVPPIGSPTQRLAFLVVGLLGAVIWIWADHGAGDRRTVAGPPASRWWVGLISAGTHLLAVLGAWLLFDAQSTPNKRLLYPVAISLLVAVVEWLTSREPARARYRRTVRVVAILGLAALTANTWSAASPALAARRGETGFRSASFANSEVVREALATSPEVVIFSNVPDGLWTVGLAGAKSTPARYDPFSSRTSGILASEIREVKALVEEGAAVILFYRNHQRPYLLDESELRQIAPCVVAETAESVMLSGLDYPLCGG